MEKIKVNIAEKLKNCEIGVKLYSPAYGEVEFKKVDMAYQHIHCDFWNAYDEGYTWVMFNRDGTIVGSANAEIMLWPSRNNRDWNTFVAPKEKVSDDQKFKPFDKVLVRNSDIGVWSISLFSHYGSDGSPICMREKYEECIPYNDDTKYLLGTRLDCPFKFNY